MGHIEGNGPGSGIFARISEISKKIATGVAEGATATSGASSAGATSPGVTTPDVVTRSGAAAPAFTPPATPSNDLPPEPPPSVGAFGLPNLEPPQPTANVPSLPVVADRAEREARVEDAENFEEDLGEILDRAEATEDRDARAEIVVEATEFVESQLGGLESDLQRDALEGTDDEFERLGVLLWQSHDPSRAVSTLNSDQSEEAFGNLIRATESVGVENAAEITDPLATGLVESDGIQEPGLLAEMNYQRPLTNAITEAAANGEGTLFGVTLAAALPDGGEVEPSTALRIAVANATVDGVAELQSEYDSAAADYETLNREIAQRFFEFGDLRSEEDIQAGIDALLALPENQEIVARYEAATAGLLTTVDGLSLVEPPADDATFGVAITGGDLHDTATAVFDGSSEIFSTDAGAELVADALEASGRGETTFIDVLESVDGYRGKADKVSDAIFRATAARAYLHVSSGDYLAAEQLFRGFERNGGLLGINDPEKLDALTELLREQRLRPIPAEDFARQFATEVQDVKARAGVDGNSRTARAFDVLGASVSVAELARYGANFSEADLQDHFRAVLELSELSGDVSKFLPEGASITSKLSTFGKLTRAAVIFDVINLGQQLSEGDYAEGGLAAAGLVGTILVTSSSVGPVGTAVGAVLSVGALVGAPILSSIREGQREDRSEERLQIFLEAAGFTEEEAQFLRDVTREDHLSVGKVFAQIAAIHPDLEAEDVLDILLHPDRHGGLDLDVLDLRSDAIDAIERLPRNDNGSFTFEGVLEAQRIIELSTGVSLNPDGITGTEAVEVLRDDFDFFDANGDGVVSFEELEMAADGPVIGSGVVPRDHRHNVARYLVRRPDLIQRLDVADDNYGSGAFDQDISRSDVAVVAEQNQHLEVLIRRWDEFVAAAGEDGKLVGVDEFADNPFATIAEETDDPELRATAEYFQENFALRRALDNAGDWFTFDTFVPPAGSISTAPHHVYQYGSFGQYGDGEISSRDLLAAALKLYVS